MRLRVALVCLLAPFLAQCVGGGLGNTVSSLFGGSSGGIFGGGSSGGASPRQVSIKTNDAKAAAALVSQYRASKGLSPVVADTTLNRAAEVQARAVAEAGALTHGQFASRMSSFGINGYSAENLVAGSKTIEPALSR